MQDKNHKQLKLEVNDSYKKDEKLTTKSEAVNGEDVINKAYLDTKLLKWKVRYHIKIFTTTLKYITTNNL